MGVRMEEEQRGSWDGGEPGLSLWAEKRWEGSGWDWGPPKTWSFCNWLEVRKENWIKINNGGQINV